MSPVDEPVTGVDLDAIKLIHPVVRAMGRVYFRYECTGFEHIPKEPTLVVANHSAYPLRLPGTSNDAGWFRVDGHPDWFVWEVPAEFSESSICEDVTVAETGARPMDEATVNAGDDQFDPTNDLASLAPGKIGNA